MFVISFVFICCNNQKKNNKKNQIKNLLNLKTGFLICRLGNGFFSNYFREYASDEKKYSHIGILSKENGLYYVYHSDASELSGVCYVKKEKLNSFLKNIKVFDFFEFNYSDSIKKNILISIKSYYKNKIKFDLKFNSFDDNELYCTELIAASINKNVIDSNKIKPTLLLNGKKLYSLEDLYLNKNITKIINKPKISKFQN